MAEDAEVRETSLGLRIVVDWIVTAGSAVAKVQYMGSKSRYNKDLPSKNPFARSTSVSRSKSWGVIVQTKGRLSVPILLVCMA